MNDKEVSMKFTNKVTNYKQLERYAETLTKISSVLSSIDEGKIKKIKSNAKTINTEGKKISTTVDKAFNVVKLGVFMRMLDKLTTNISRYTNKSAEYLENWNLLDVAFQNNTIEAEKFVNKLTEMYGLDESWGYRTVGMFKQLSNAMGLSSETGNLLSKTLTQLAIDTSSLYNIGIKDTVSILQSGLAGLIIVWLALNLLNCWNLLY